MTDNRSHDDWDHEDESDEDESEEVVFHVSNPQSTVTVSTYISGRVANVELSPTVSRMTERELAQEIQVLSDLARDQARAGQHALVTSVMTALGNDRVYVTGFLRRQIGLPTPDDANEEQARVFATRYYGPGRDRD